MSTKNPKLFKNLTLAIVILSVILSACIRQSDVSDYVKPGSLKLLAPEYKDTNTCVVFKCIEKKPTLSFFTGKIPSLDGGSCEFKTYQLTKELQKREWDLLFSPKLITDEIDPTIVVDVEESLEYPRLFMFGTGNSLVVGDESQRFCNGNLGFVIHDLGGPDIPESIIPDEGNLSCVLQSNIIPLFIYKSSSEIGFRKKLIIALSTNGPVIIVPDPETSENEPKFQSLVDGFFPEIKANCKGCITAAIVKFGDSKTVLAYKNKLANKDNSPIDMIGYKFENKNIETCSPKKAVTEMVNFSKFIVNATRLPSIIYMNISEGPSNKVDCSWEEEDIVEFYGEITKAIPEFVLFGVSGIGIYDSNSLGSYDTFNSWFRNCQRYYQKKDNRLNYATRIAFVEGGVTGISKCISDSLNTGLYLYEPPTDFTNPVKPISKTQACGDVCFDTEKFPTLTGGFNYRKCESINRFFARQYAYENQVDPNIILALIDRSGGLDGAEEVNLNLLFGKVEACKDYTGKSGNIRCITETFAEYYNLAKVKFGGDNSKDEKLRTYFGVFGSISGKIQFNSALGIYSSAQPTVGSVDEILARSIRIGETCGLCKE